MSKQISVSYSPSARVWVAATLVDGQPSAELLELFGTHILPTPFTAECNGFFVVNQIAQLNKDAEVSLARLS
jgi:hypothetical protein